MHIALIGYGRFGRAFAGLAIRAGHSFNAHDPGVESAMAPTLEAAVAGADLVVVAVPIGVMGPVLGELRPVLNPSQLVLDVASVKVEPIQAMERALGEDIPWIGTHPLFGPASLSRGERPLEVVVCPNPVHPGAMARARAFLESIECQVVETDADTHDRLMARTHALAFFLAKGLLALDLDEPVPFSPPSYKAMNRTVETVRWDAGHLFAAIQLENPHAASARRRFIDALQNIDDDLETEARAERTADGTLAARDALAIPGLGAASPDLAEARTLIDEVDEAIVVLMGRRVQLARQAGAAKAATGHRVLDPDRERRMLDDRHAWGEIHNLEPGGITEVFEALMRQSRFAQRGDERDS